MNFSMTQVENETKTVKNILVSYLILATLVTASLTIFVWCQVQSEEESIANITMATNTLVEETTEITEPDSEEGTTEPTELTWTEGSTETTFSERTVKNTELNSAEGTTESIEPKTLPNLMSLATRNYKQIFVNSDEFSELQLEKDMEDDVLAFQEVRFHNKFWSRPQPKSVEIFNKLERTFFVVSAAQVKHNWETYQQSYGLAISLKSGFQYENHTVVFVENSREKKRGI